MPTDFTEKNPDEILEPTELDKYRVEMDHFYLKLVGLHVDMFILQKIVDFPFELFTSLEDGFFFNRVIQNFLKISVLEITKLAADSGNVRTLVEFKNYMARAVKDEFKADYRQLLKKVKFNSRTKAILKKAKHIRNTRIAHSTSSNPVPAADSISFGEIKVLVEELTKLFEAAAFSSGYEYLILSYSPKVRHPVGHDPRPDIEKILDCVARESEVLRMPKENPLLWGYRRESLSEEHLRQINHYRRKFGLPEV
jgi:hypothetical protein